MTTFTLTALALIALALVAYVLGLTAGKADRDAGSSLRELVQAKADGHVTAEEFDRRQVEIQSSLVPPPSNKHLYALPGVFLALIVAGVHSWISPASQESQHTVPIKMSSTTSPINTTQPRPGGDLEQMTKRLAERLKREPGDGQGWSLLARAYAEMRQYQEAETAFEQAAKLIQPDAALLADWANARVSAQAGKWDKTALDLITRALAANPNHLKALSLAGKAAYAREDFAEAISYWQKMKVGATPDSMEAKEADAGITEARARMTGGSKPSASTMSRIENIKRQ